MDEDKARLKKKLPNSTTFIRTYSRDKYLVRKYINKSYIELLWIIQESIHTQSGAVYALAL